MKATFAHAAPIPAFGAAPAGRVPRTAPSRCQWVDALVTVAVVAWFAVALASMVGELARRRVGCGNAGRDRCRLAERGRLRPHAGFFRSGFRIDQSRA